MLQQVLERMRRAREEQGMDIEALSRKTRIRVHQLEAVEQGRFDQLPRGVYARAVIRAYASAVGMEPNNAVAEVAPLLPDPEDPLEGIARVHGYTPPRRAHPPLHAEPPQGETSPDVPVTRATAIPHLRPDVVARAVPAIVDGVLLTAIQLVLVTLSARVAGVSIAELMDFAAPAVLMLGGLIAGLYFLLLGGVAGATFGDRALRLAPTGGSMRAGAGQRMDLAAACRRGGVAAARELSIVVDLAVPLIQAWRSGGTRGAARPGTRWEGTAPVR